jgi:hypothetical protein
MGWFSLIECEVNETRYSRSKDSMEKLGQVKIKL